MDNTNTNTAQPVQSIDLTKQMDVAYWCNIFGVEPQQLRDAVQHAGHQVDAVRRYLADHGMAR
jgi:hypothetical protein